MMNQHKIRVGIVGLNPHGQWASKSHYPALRHLADDFELVGVANSTYESAQQTATALHIPIAFPDAEAMFQSDQIDLVTIAVKVPYHFALVKAALQAGKHVYCEHPLGVSLAETIELAALAAKMNLVAVVGNQLLFAPAIIYLKQLLQENYVGRILSTTLIGSGIFWTNQTTSALYYMSDNNSGATMLTVPLGHTLAGFQQVVGNIDTLKAVTTRNYNTVKLTDTGETKPKTAADQIMVMGQLASGAAFNIHYRAGLSKATNFLWEINGTEGDLQVTANHGHAQFAQLSVMGARKEDNALMPLSVFPDSSLDRNVAAVYKAVANDIRNNTRTAPTFKDAVDLMTLLNRIETAANS